MLLFQWRWNGNCHGEQMSNIVEIGSPLSVALGLRLMCGDEPRQASKKSSRSETLLVGLLEEAASWKDQRLEERGKEAENQEVLLNAGKKARSLALNCGGKGISSLQ
jgi:hypothetical protein